MSGEKTPHTARKIAIILEGRVQYERDILRGIRDFAAEQGDWLLRLEMPGKQIADFLERWSPDGILFQSSGLDSLTVERLAAHPNSIHVSESPGKPVTRSVGLDNLAIGETAARYLAEREPASFGFAGFGDISFSRKRGESFCHWLEKSGEEVSVLELDSHPSESEVLQWLRELAKPSGVFATHDECALYLSTLCRSDGIEIPGEISLLGVDNDTLICDIAWPQISSIAVPSRKVGWEAANRLNRLLDEEGDSRDPFQDALPPVGVVARQSTDRKRTEDELVNRALIYMESHFRARINIDDVLREIGVSRRLLERKFARHVGRSPHRELLRMRIEEASRLLRECADPLPVIAPQCGFSGANQLVAQFKKEKGMTPGAYRKGL